MYLQFEPLKSKQQESEQAGSTQGTCVRKRACGCLGVWLGTLIDIPLTKGFKLSGWEGASPLANEPEGQQNQNLTINLDLYKETEKLFRSPVRSTVLPFSAGRQYLPRDDFLGLSARQFHLVHLCAGAAAKSIATPSEGSSTSARVDAVLSVPRSR